MKKEHSPRGKSGRTSRREFCQVMTLAALGVWTTEGPWAGRAPGRELMYAPPANPGPGKENNMDKKVKSVTAKVISVKGSCWHKVGDTAVFTGEGVTNKICIHALYSMLPKVFAMMYGARFPWLQNPDVAVHACPDPVNPVVFEITRTYES